MPFREGPKPNQPFVISKSDLSSQFTVLSAEETAKLGGPEGSKAREHRKGDKLSLEQAETIVGRENFFGPEAVEKAFSIKLEWEQIPEIPFSKEDLERAAELGQFLVLRTDKAPDGQPLTMLKMDELLKDDFAKKGKGKVLYDTKEEWKRKSEFFTTETPRITWALTSRTTVPGTKNRNYLEQTEDLVGYVVTEVFKNQLVTSEYQAAMDEFQAYHDKNFKGKTREQINKMLTDEWQRYAKELSELKINEITRQTPADALYDMIIHFQNTGKKILDAEYTWTNRRSSDGSLVFVGYFDADGAGVFSWRPDSSDGDLGVFFSRSL